MGSLYAVLQRLLQFSRTSPWGGAGGAHGLAFARRGAGAAPARAGAAAPRATGARRRRNSCRWTMSSRRITKTWTKTWMITSRITGTISRTPRIPSGRDGAGPPLGPGGTARLAAPRPGALLDLGGRQARPGLSMPGTRTTIRSCTPERGCSPSSGVQVPGPLARCPASKGTTAMTDRAGVGPLRRWGLPLPRIGLYWAM